MFSMYHPCWIVLSDIICLPLLCSGRNPPLKPLFLNSHWQIGVTSTPLLKAWLLNNLWQIGAIYDLSSSPSFPMFLDTLKLLPTPSARTWFDLVIDTGELAPTVSSIRFLFLLFSHLFPTSLKHNFSDWCYLHLHTSTLVYEHPWTFPHYALVLSTPSWLAHAATFTHDLMPMILYSNVLIPQNYLGGVVIKIPRPPSPCYTTNWCAAIQ